MAYTQCTSLRNIQEFKLDGLSQIIISHKISKPSDYATLVL